MKNTILLLSLTLLVVLIVSACGGLETAAPTVELLPTTEAILQAEPAPSITATPTELVVSGTISIWHSLEDPQLPALLRQIAAFQEIYPNVYFDILYVPQVDLRAGYVEAAREGSGPTILIGSGEWGPELFIQGLVASLDDLAGSDFLNTLNATAVEAARLQGSLIGIPYWVEGVVLYRNRLLISKAPETFSELILLSQGATAGDMFGAYLERSFFFSGAHLYGLDGTLFSEAGEPAFNSPEGLAWLELISSFEQAGPTDFFTDDDLNLFKEGRVGFIIDGTWNRDALAEAIGTENLVIDPWPIYARGTLSGFLRTENIYLNPRALDEIHSISWKFIEFLMSPEAQSDLADVGLIPAISGSPVNPVAGQVVISDSLIAQAMRALVDAVPYPNLPTMSLYTSSLDIALRSVFEQAANPSEALQGAETAVREALAAFEATATPSP